MNEYVLTPSRVWVRNFTKSNVPFVDINHLISESDYRQLLENELQNRKRRHPEVETDTRRPKVLIVSDGFDFERKQKLLAKIPSDVTIIGVNKSLARWKLMGNNPIATPKRAMNFYLVNNPFPEAKSFLPREYFPKCIASTRTHPEFVSSYRSNLYLYSPVKNKQYSGPHRGIDFEIDDYRNPICGAIGIAYRMGAQKIMLFCCDDSFADERPNAVKLECGLWTYRPQLMSHEIIDANLYWLKKAGISVADHSSGPKFSNAEYIAEEGIATFLAGDK